jgi:hypothetical protein
MLDMDVTPTDSTVTISDPAKQDLSDSVFVTVDVVVDIDDNVTIVEFKHVPEAIVDDV